jgi:hypothetical protein
LQPDPQLRSLRRAVLWLRRGAKGLQLPDHGARAVQPVAASGDARRGRVDRGREDRCEGVRQRPVGAPSAVE